MHVDPAAGVDAGTLAAALAAGDPPVIVRDHMIEHGFFDLDPCNLHHVTGMDGGLGVQSTKVEVMMCCRFV